MHKRTLILGSCLGFQVKFANYVVEVGILKCAVIQKAIILKGDI
jgi:hypothetical protein